MYLNKTYMKPEVQMRRFIWNINMNPFPHSKTAHGQPTATAPTAQVTIGIDWLTRPIGGSFLAIEAQIHQINWPPTDMLRWKLLK